MNTLDKNLAIKNAIKETRSRRKNMSCKTFRCKVDRDHLSKEQKSSLFMFFLESKRLYNYILNESKTGSIPNSKDYKKLYDIYYFDKDHNKIPYKIQYIGSSIISDIITVMKDSLNGLSATKAKGRKVGALKFKSECNSIRLRQNNITHKIIGSNKIKIQGIKKPIRVNGLKQLNGYNNIEIATANLLYDGNDYFISITCYVDKIKYNPKNDIIGIDMGCSTSITLSNGSKIDVSVEESERLKGLQAKLAGQNKRSNNWYKTKRLIKKEYNKMTNKRNDISNKIVHELVSNYKTIVIQDEQISEWKENKINSKKVQNSILGRVKNKLSHHAGTIILDRWFPTTQYCPICKKQNKISLSDRTYTCTCGYSSDRDIHAASNMIMFYKEYKQSVGTPDLMPQSKIYYSKYKDLMRTGSPLGL